MKFEINSENFEKRVLDQEALHKELDLIQNCVDRIAHNAFLYKGWFITLSAGVAALSVSNDRPLWVAGIGLILLTIIVWLLDAFFLRTERRFHRLYDWVREERQKGNFEHRYDLNPNRLSPRASLWSAFWSLPSIFLYLPVGFTGLIFIVVKIVKEYGCVG